MFVDKPLSFWEKHVGSVFRIGDSVVMLIGVVRRRLRSDSVFLIFPEDKIPLCSPEDLDKLGAELMVDDNDGTA